MEQRGARLLGADSGRESGAVEDVPHPNGQAAMAAGPAALSQARRRPATGLFHFLLFCGSTVSMSGRQISSDTDDDMNDALPPNEEPTSCGVSQVDYEEMNVDTYDNSRYQGLMAQSLELHHLKKITNEFSPEQILGKGGYATVYRGVEEDGRVIAVKKLIIGENVDFKQFENEAQHLSNLTHQNIVKLDGYCYGEEKKLVQHEGRNVMAHEIYMLLCFEYLPNLSLDMHLRDASSGLNWPQRYKIIEGICNGLHYLHEGRDGSPIIHRDLKPANILLDDNMVPKIGDFGISRLMSEDKTHTCTNNLIGTLGYLAPEFIEKKIISKKLDIFSLGVIIIDILTGGRKYCDISETSNDEFIEDVLKKWQARWQKEGSTEEYSRQIWTCIIIGLECMDRDRKKRPTIVQIIRKLNKTILSRMSPTPEICGQASRQNNVDKDLKCAIPPGPQQSLLSLECLKEITDNFCSEREIGDLTGVVYKGVHQSGETIAVKKLLQTTGVRERKFRNMVADLIALKHKNLTKLIGYCHEEVVERNGDNILMYKQKNLLCYEYLHNDNGSLDKYIYDKSRELDWNARLKIIKGICEGLHFLQKGSSKSIIHLNLKPGSIFLDDKMVPKIGDYGLYWLFDQEYTSRRAQDILGQLQQ